MTQNNICMQTINVEIVNPKARRLLRNLAEMQIIRILQPRISFPDVVETHWASESVLAKDWLTSQEDEAWKNL
jgi:hypothetical protein